MAEIESSTSSLGQLPLEIRLRDDATLENYLPLASTTSALQVLQDQATPAGEAILYLYGPAGCGKSHLLQASCQMPGVQALYLPLAELRQYPAADVLHGVSDAQRLCLDDIQAVLGDPVWEMALFELYNQARERGCQLLVASDAAPRNLVLELEDLRSRLSWGLVFQLSEGDDEEKAAILRFRAARRGMNLSVATSSYIVSRAPRSMDQLLAVLDTLDEASLVHQRTLSIPFVKAALGW